MASFNDPRCMATDECVYSTDPLFFTCKLNDVPLLRVVFPNGHREHFSVGTNITTKQLPAGFIVTSLNVSEIKVRNISLTLSIANASLLESGVIRCDDTTPNNKVMAGCQVCGKF